MALFSRDNGERSVIILWIELLASEISALHIITLCYFILVLFRCHGDGAADSLATNSRIRTGSSPVNVLNLSVNIPTVQNKLNINCLFRRVGSCTNSARIVVFFLLGDSPASEFYVPPFRNTLFQLSLKMEQGVPKRRYTKLRRRGITKKKEYNIQEHGESLKSKRKNSFEFIFEVVL